MSGGVKAGGDFDKEMMARRVFWGLFERGMGLFKDQPKV